MTRVNHQHVVMNQHCLIRLFSSRLQNLDFGCGGKILRQVSHDAFHVSFLWAFSQNTVKPVLVVTSIKQPTCIKQPEESCPKVHRLIYLNCIKQLPAFGSHILSFPWVAA